MVLTLIEGRTYRFDQSDSSNSGQVVEDAITGTVNLGDEAVKGDANLSVTGVVGTSGS